VAIRFEAPPLGNRVILEYKPEGWDARWVWAKLRTEGRVRIAKVFHFQRADLLGEPPDEDDFGDIDGFVYRFSFGSRRDGYPIRLNATLSVLSDIGRCDVCKAGKRYLLGFPSARSSCNKYRD